MQSPELSVIVPTYNESENIQELINRLEACLSGVEWEVVFADDDSTDGTARVVREIGQQNPRVRCVHRIGRRGLSSACVEGILATSSPYVAVMDADLQHDEQILPEMLQAAKEKDVDIVIGSRYVEGGGVGEWDASRAKLSQMGTRVSALVTKANLSDPMSGFFLMPRTTFDNTVRKLSSIGFKILVDIFASSSQPLRFREVPYHFRTRTMGESKLDSKVMWEFGMLLLDKLVGHIIPVRFVSFMIVGLIGVIPHMLVVWLMFNGLGITFMISQSVATFVAMTSNFALNNILTYRDRRLTGWSWIHGWISFVVVCSIGAAANVGVAQVVFEEQPYWAVASMAGILVGAVWNYFVTSLYTWSQKPARRSEGAGA